MQPWYFDIIDSTTPLSENLEGCVGKTVIIKLRGGKSVLGKLLDFDQYINLVIRDAVELLDDNDHGPKRADSKLGTIILRSDNILVIAIESPF
jgi:small nuclear ribonucleoprotein (snRNP)-like protein